MKNSQKQQSPDNSMLLELKHLDAANAALTKASIVALEENRELHDIVQSYYYQVARILESRDLRNPDLVEEVRELQQRAQEVDPSLAEKEDEHD